MQAAVSATRTVSAVDAIEHHRNFLNGSVLGTY
jgi:hypothetical protein